MAQYGKASYWDDRYTKDPEPFDWYQRYDGIKEILSTYVKKEDQVLMSGAGNSRLSEDMASDGYKSIFNIDISKVVVEQMVAKTGDRMGFEWKQMDATSLDFADENFDAVVDKALMDSLLCGEGSTANVNKMCSEVSRCVTPNGGQRCCNEAGDEPAAGFAVCCRRTIRAHHQQSQPVRVGSGFHR